MSKLRFGNIESSSHLVIEHENGAPDVNIKSTDLISKSTPVANRQALKATTGSVDGQAVWQSDIGLMYTWDSSKTITDDDKGYTIYPTDGGGCWVAEVDGIINGRVFGVKGNIIADDTDAIENTLRAAKLSYGGIVSFKGCGTMRTTRAIKELYRAVKIIGDGRLGVYPYESTGYTDANKLSTIYVDHNERDAFTMSQDGSTRGIEINGLNFIRKSDSTCISALGFDTNGTVTGGEDYGYDIQIERCGIFDFESASDLYTTSTSTEPTMAAITFNNCAINRNEYTARTIGTNAWNGFTFTNNKAGAQTVGGLDIKAHKFEEHGNFFENTPNPIVVSGGYRGFNSSSSYFEANTGTALINLSSLRSPKIGTHTILNCLADMKVKVKNVGLMKCDVPYIGEEVIKTIPSEYGNSNSIDNDIENIDTLTYGVSSLSIGNSDMNREPSNALSIVQKSQSGLNFHRAINPISGKVMAVEQYTTTGTGIKAYTTTVSGNTNEYVSVTVMIKVIPDGLGVGSPYFTLNVNGTADTGTRDYTFTEASLYFDEGEWAVFHGVIKLGTNMTSLGVYVYPLGISPDAGRVTEIMPPNIVVTKNLKDCKPYFNKTRLESLQIIPTTGTWERGDRFYTTTPVANGYEGWECVVAGAPGTWKTFGTIEA